MYAGINYLHSRYAFGGGELKKEIVQKNLENKKTLGKKDKIFWKCRKTMLQKWIKKQNQHSAISIHLSCMESIQFLHEILPYTCGKSGLLFSHAVAVALSQWHYVWSNHCIILTYGNVSGQRGGWGTPPPPPPPHTPRHMEGISG